MGHFHFACDCVSVLPPGLQSQNDVPDLELRQMQFRLWRSKPNWRVLFIIDEQQHLVTIVQLRHERRRWLSDAEKE